MFNRGKYIQVIELEMNNIEALNILEACNNNTLEASEQIDVNFKSLKQNYN